MNLSSAIRVRQLKELGQSPAWTLEPRQAEEIVEYFARVCAMSQALESKHKMALLRSFVQAMRIRDPHDLLTSLQRFLIRIL